MENAQRDKIIDAACILYKQRRSCKNVTMDEIAAYCGISKRTLYECFSNKEQLVFECVDRIIQYIYKDCEKFSHTAKHSFEMFFGSIRIAHGYLKDVYVFIKEIKTNYPDVFEKLVSSHMVFAKTGMSEFLEQAKKEGFIWKYINERFFISILEMNMYYSSKTEFLDANAPYGEETVKVMVLYTLLRGVSTARGIEYIDEYWTNKIRNNNNKHLRTE